MDVTSRTVLIITLLVYSNFFIDSVEVGWKFWKKGTATTLAPETVTSNTVTTSNGIVSAKNPDSVKSSLKCWRKSKSKITSTTEATATAEDSGPSDVAKSIEIDFKSSVEPLGSNPDIEICEDASSSAANQHKVNENLNKNRAMDLISAEESRQPPVQLPNADNNSQKGLSTPIPKVISTTVVPESSTIKARAGWKFWKKSKKNKIKTTSTALTTETPEAVIPGPASSALSVVERTGTDDKSSTSTINQREINENDNKKRADLTGAGQSSRPVVQKLNSDSDPEKGLSTAIPKVISTKVVPESSTIKARAGWKFWKRSKKDKTKPTSTALTTATSEAVTLRPDKANADLNIFETIGTDVESNARPQHHNPTEELTKDLSYEATNQHKAGGKDSRDWAVDFTDAGQSSQLIAYQTVLPSPYVTTKAIVHRADSKLQDDVDTTETDVKSNAQSSSLEPFNPAGTGEIPQLIVQKPRSTNHPKSKLPLAIPVVVSNSVTSTSPPDDIGTASHLSTLPMIITSIKAPPKPPRRMLQRPRVPPRTRERTIKKPLVSTVLPAGVATGPIIVDNIPKKVYSSNPIYSKGTKIFPEDLENLFEALFVRDTTSGNNAWKYITLNLQKQTTSGSPIEVPLQPLLTVNPAALQIPTIEKLLKLYDNYQLNSNVAEYISPLQRAEESQLLDAILNTRVMKAAMEFLAQKRYVSKDLNAFKDTLRSIWFNLYSRANGRIGSAGFERVFLSELIRGTELNGLHNWLYFNAQLEKRRVNYMGYIKKLDLSNKAAIVKFHAKFDNTHKLITTMFVGTSPELEMAIYTVCFFVHANEACPVSLGGTKFEIITHKIRYGGKDLIESAYPNI